MVKRAARGGQLRFFTKKQVEDIHVATLEVLKTVGLRTKSKPILEVFSKGGAEVDVKDGRIRIPEHLVKESLRDQVTLIASGGITLAEHVPKAIACGADLVALDTTILVALQARFEGELASPANGRIRPERLDEKWGEQRLVNLVGAWHDQLIEILSAMGMRDVRRLRGDIGRAMFKEDLEKEAFSDIIQRA